MDELIGMIFAVLSGVLVSIVTLWLAGWQRAKEERRTEERRRKAILAGIGRELRWNRSVTKGIYDISNMHYKTGMLSTVAFERHGADLATVAPNSLEVVFQHYSTVCAVREAVRILGGLPNRDEHPTLHSQWIELSNRASVDVHNSATRALKSMTALPE